MIKNILLDLDDTILDFHKAEIASLKKTFKQLGLEPDEEVLARYHIINQKHWQLLEEKKITRREVLVNRFQQLFEEYGISCDPDKTQAIYEMELSYHHDFMDGAQEFMDVLVNQYDLYVVSNGTGFIQDRRLKESGLDKYFKDVFISEYVGHDKPSKDFFDHCFAQISDFTKENTILIGDSLTSDIKGGNNAGIRTIWFHPETVTNHSEIHPDYEVHALSEIPDVLKQL